MTKNSSNTAVGVIILAAGLGKRMRSSLPKVLHEIGGRPILFHILDRVLEVTPNSPIALVVGHDRERVEAAVRANANYSPLSITFVHQPSQRGTGDAARVAMDSKWGEGILAGKRDVLVLPGDLPLMSEALVAQMAAPLGRGEALRLLTTELSDPTGYGRVVRRGKGGAVLKIVEQKDASEREKLIREVACSIYLFQSAFLRFGLQRLSNKNAQGEYYLTDLVASASRAKKKIDVLQWLMADDLRGVNDPWELAHARRILYERCARDWALRGVKFVDPWNTWIDITVELEEDVTISPGVILLGNTKVARGATLGPRVTLRDVVVGENATIRTGTVGESSIVEADAQVGPYAHLRPGSQVGAGSKIGNFVELKKTKVGARTSIAHLSYLGDAEVGSNVNIGCGFVTCNYDGRDKHKTVIEDNVFMGSDCQVIAPLRVGKGAYVASGSTLTQDVDADALAIARAPQVSKPGYAKKYRKREV